MAWFYYFNADKSFAYRCENEKLKDSEVAKLGDGITMVELSEPPTGMPDDEWNFVSILDDGSIGIQPNVLFGGTKRYKRHLIDYLQMYAPLSDLDRPEDWKEQLLWATNECGETVVEQFLADRVITDTEKQELYRLANALD